MEHPEISPRESPQVVVVPANGDTEDTLVCLAGEHDLSSVGELVRAIAMVVDAGQSDLVIGLGRVEFLDSATLDQILAAHVRLGAEGRTARTRHPSRPARYLLEFCELTHLVEP
jgi:anti-anti-sigma regulatory factor